MEVDKRQHLLEIFKDLDTAMLFTHSPDQGLRGRPMALAEILETGELVFPTGLNDAKIAEIEANPQVALGAQGKSKWASLSGRARISRDRTLIDRLWKEPWKLWFPEGKDDPTLCLLIIDPAEGEYWDNSGARGIRFAIEAAKAYISGREPDAKKMDENAKVKL